MQSGNTDICDESLYRFAELIDMWALSRLQDGFFRATAIPNCVVDANGELLAMSAGENTCTVFHRTCPEAAKRCRDSNLALIC